MWGRGHVASRDTGSPGSGLPDPCLQTCVQEHRCPKEVQGLFKVGPVGGLGGTLLDRQAAASVLPELSYWGDPEVGLRTGFIFSSGPPALVKFYSAWGLCWDSSFCAPGFLVHGFGPGFVETRKLCLADWTGLGHRFCNAGLTNSLPRFNPRHHLVFQP